MCFIFYFNTRRIQTHDLTIIWSWGTDATNTKLLLTFWKCFGSNCNLFKLYFCLLQVGSIPVRNDIFDEILNERKLELLLDAEVISVLEKHRSKPTSSSRHRTISNSGNSFLNWFSLNPMVFHYTLLNLYGILRILNQSFWVLLNPVEFLEIQ